MMHVRQVLALDKRHVALLLLHHLGHFCLVFEAQGLEVRLGLQFDGGLVGRLAGQGVAAHLVEGPAVSIGFDTLLVIALGRRLT